MLGTSINLISLTGCMNPTDPPSVGSLGMHLTQVPQFSVMPYPREGVTNSHGRGMKDNRPWMIVQAKTIRRKSKIYGLNGADPDVIRTTFPPRAART